MKQNDVLEKLHKVEVEILKEFIRICEENNLCYFLVGGTLLGAVRHKGFIPWDDDIDIAMPRKDYEEFINKYSKELNENYHIHSIENDDKYYLNFLKIKKKNTFFDEKMIENIDTCKEIWIDILPMDYVKDKNRIFDIKARIVKSLTPIIFYKRGIYKKSELPRPILAKIMSIFSIKTLIKIQKFVMTRDNKKQRKYLTSYAGSYNYLKETASYDTLFPLKQLNFENIKVNVPNDYDVYLKNIYGDYMTLPKKEDRVGHLPKKIIFDTRKEK